MNAIALSPEQFIFAEDYELKTTSLKIAEAFGKLHKHVLRDIEKIIAQTADLAGGPKFGLVEYEYQNNLGKTVKAPAYEMGKDGFILVVMGYTGEKAMAIKVAYINAFNFMAEKLFPKRYGLIDPPEPPTISKAQAGELFTMVANKARSSGKPNAYFWCRFQNHFKLSSYKDTPAHQFDEAKDYLRRLEGEDTDQFRMLTPQELAAIIQQNTPSPTNPQSSLKTDDHIVLPLYQNGLVKRLTVKLDHQHQAGHYQNARWFVSRSDDQLTVEQLDHNELLMSEQKFIHYLTHECGYIVVKKTEVASKLMA